VADGMGGYEGGQEASRLAIETVRYVYDRDFNGQPQEVLVSAFRSAHDTIQRYAFEHPEFHGMGTTCTALSIVDRQLYFAHVGDSRLYLIRGGAISRHARSFLRGPACRKWDCSIRRRRVAPPAPHPYRGTRIGR
jgi:protein phosphatase